VAGGLPALTYVPRDEHGLEQKIADYIDERYRILSVSGPTKTGKTVLLRKALKDTQAIWVSGGAISDIDDFWATVVDGLRLCVRIEEATRATPDSNTSMSGMTGEEQSFASSSTEDRAAMNRSASAAARGALRSNLSPLVIDDFHYISSDVQLQIVRGLKDLVFEGLPVIVISVPHRAYDVVRVEKEMTGRVEQVEVGFWSNDELMAIAHRGFSALNISDKRDKIARRLASESFSSPHLMQDFCLQVCKVNGIRESARDAVVLKAPEWGSFFAGRSASAAKTAFQILARGPSPAHRQETPYC